MKHFDPSEFSCQCGCGGGFSDMDPDFLSMLDTARAVAQIPFQLSSAYRCEKHNEAVGGVQGSAHTKGMAVDIIAKTGFERWRIFAGLMKAGFTRIGMSGKFIHCDSDPHKPQHVLWPY
jgi:uncharacterized protein YcbK (DUF882 family)